MESLGSHPSQAHLPIVQTWVCLQTLKISFVTIDKYTKKRVFVYVRDVLSSAIEYLQLATIPIQLLQNLLNVRFVWDLTFWWNLSRKTHHRLVFCNYAVKERIALSHKVCNLRFSYFACTNPRRIQRIQNMSHSLFLEKQKQNLLPKLSFHCPIVGQKVKIQQKHCQKMWSSPSSSNFLTSTASGLLPSIFWDTFWQTTWILNAIPLTSSWQTYYHLSHKVHFSICDFITDDPRYFPDFWYWGGGDEGRPGWSPRPGDNRAIRGWTLPLCQRRPWSTTDSSGLFTKTSRSLIVTSVHMNLMWRSSWISLTLLTLQKLRMMKKTPAQCRFLNWCTSEVFCESADPSRNKSAH